MHKILFASSEAYPLVKTGGLADVSGALPRALQSLKHDVRLILPAYPDAVARIGPLKTVTQLNILGFQVHLQQGTLPGSRLKTWLVDCPALFNRQGNPYLSEHGTPWHDNAQRFAMFSRVISEISMNRADLNWSPDIVHCNDWQTGLVPALLSLEEQPPASIFTIHNMAYQGLFPHEMLLSLSLPHSFWSHEALEFHGQLSFIKGGLVFADRINTVSPTYAKEIQTEEFGYGLDGLLRHRNKHLSGILNGIDTREWNPSQDPHLSHHFNRQSLSKKTGNKTELQQRFGLQVDESIPLLVSIGRLVEQKGIDLILDALPKLPNRPVQMILLGSGDKGYEARLQDWAEKHPEKLAVNLGYDEGLAHQLEAGADIFLMPSRFEPCGLNQMYSLRYGALPLVRRAGGLADTVLDADQDPTEGNGFVFDTPTVEALLDAITRALDAYADSKRWRKLQRNAMAADHSWQQSAQHYLLLYETALAQRGYPV